MKIWSWPKDRPVVEQFFRQSGQASAEVERAVDEVIEAVRAGGDRAVAELTRRFDKADIAPGRFEVPAARLRQAWDRIAPELQAALRTAARRIEAFHKKQRVKGWSIREPGFGRLDQRVLPLERVALYVPGGTAPLVSTVLMTAIPAKVAGVDETILVTPPAPDGWPADGILAAAHLVGVDRVLRVGGTPAMAALAMGTETIPRVDKVVGPGNIYVTTAKKKLYGAFDIDGIAGPSEVLVIADRAARLDLIAADLLSQAEHTGDNPCGVVLIGGDRALAEALIAEVERQMAALTRREMAERSIREQGYIILVKSADEAVELANRKAPEHLEIVAAGARRMADRVRHAGAIFLGHWSPEPLGDYMAGPNHTLPTGGTARFFSPLNVWSFYRTSHTIECTREGLAGLAEGIITLAESEGLTAHAQAVRIRHGNGGVKTRSRAKRAKSKS